eukprot:9475471-Pyramimonas_sp.AAC.1
MRRRVAAPDPRPGRCHQRAATSAADDLPDAQLGRALGPAGGGARRRGAGSHGFPPPARGARRRPPRAV